MKTLGYQQFWNVTPATKIEKDLHVNLTYVIIGLLGSLIGPEWF